MTMPTTAFARLADIAAELAPLLLDASVKGAVVLATAWAVVIAMRRSTSAARHLTLLLALAGLLAMPVLSAALPELAVLPRRPVPAAAEQSPTDAGAPAVPVETTDSARTWRSAPGKAQGPHAAMQKDGIIENIGPAVEAADATTPIAAADAPKAETDPAGEFPLRGALSTGMGLWAIGVLVCLAPAVLGWISLWRLRRSSRLVAEGRLVGLARQAARHVGLKRPVTILVSSRRSMPMVWGIGRPKLLLPAAAESWTDQRLRVVLLHELAHAVRWDCAAKLIGHLACAVYWFNPLAWLAFRRLQCEAETACDDLVLAAGSKPVDYARHILEVASGLEANLLAAYSSIAMARKSRLEGRLLAILDGRRNRRRLRRPAVILAAVLATTIIVPMAMVHASCDDSNDDACFRLLGVIPDGGEELLDDQGRPAGSMRFYTDHQPVWDKDRMRRDFVFEFPAGGESVRLTGPVIIQEAGEDRTLSLDMNALTVVRRKDAKQLLVLPRTLPRTRPGWLWRKKHIKRVDITLRWYGGPRGKPDCTFTGPFAPGTTVEDDAGKDYRLTVKPLQTHEGERLLEFEISSKVDMDFWMALSVYDAAGRWHLAQYAGGSRIRGGGESQLKFRLRGLDLKAIERVAFNEKPHEQAFRDIVVRYRGRPDRYYSPYLDEIASRLAISPVDPVKVRDHNFASPREALACIDIVRGHLVSKAWEAIRHGKPKLDPEDLDEKQSELLHSMASEWASSTDQDVQAAGLQMGLWGNWPEFVQPVIDIVRSDSRSRGRAAKALYDYREHLTPGHLAQIRQLLIDRDDRDTYYGLLTSIIHGKSPAAIREATTLAKSDKVWLWWPALRIPAVRKALTDEPDQSKEVRLRLALADPACPRPPLSGQAKRMLPGLLSQKLLQMNLSTFSEVLKKTADNLDRATCTEVFVSFLEEIYADWDAHKFDRYVNNNWWAVDRMSRYLNLWHGLDIGGLGTDLTQEAADRFKTDWKAVAAEAITKTRALRPASPSVVQDVSPQTQSVTRPGPSVIRVPRTGRELDTIIRKALSRRPVDAEALREALPEIDKLTVIYGHGSDTKAVRLARKEGKWDTEETIRKLAQPFEDGTQIRVRVSLHLPPDLRKQRDALLAQADLKLRRVLLQLAEQYPQLERTNWGSLMERTARSSPAGEVRIGVGWYPRGTGKSDGTTKTVREEDRYRVLVVLMPRGSPIEQLLHSDLYPHLDLRGVVVASATDKRLDAQLKKIVKDALAPLGELDKAAAKGKEPAIPPPTQVREP